jgi:hypothetical protein
MEVIQIDDAGGAPSPKVVAVDVRRATVASPFRSTADLEPRQPIEGSVEVPGAHFAATALSPTSTMPRDFLDHVARRIADLPESRVPPSAPGPDVILDVEVEESVGTVVAAAAIPYPSTQLHPTPAPAQPGQRGAVTAALLIGIIVGFCAGLVVSGWM